MNSETILLATNIISLVLFILSEIIGVSKCKSNGVFQFMFRIPCINENILLDVRPVVVNNQI